MLALFPAFLHLHFGGGEKALYSLQRIGVASFNAANLGSIAVECFEVCRYEKTEKNGRLPLEYHFSLFFCNKICWWLCYIVLSLHNFETAALNSQRHKVLTAAEVLVFLWRITDVQRIAKN